MAKINEIIWQSLESGILNLENLSQIQLEEINYLNVGVDSLIKGYKAISVYLSIEKTHFGYKIKRNCENAECGSLWTIKINVPSGTGKIVCNLRCNHSSKSKVTGI